MNHSDEYLENMATETHVRPSDQPSFIPLDQNPSEKGPRRPELDLPEKTGMDSPMAEFDIDRRRTGSHGTSRPRRSRPLAQHFLDLVMWRNTKDSGFIFGFGLVLLLSLSIFSLISIFAYLSMISLVLITSFVLIRQINLAFQQQTSEHPFRGLLEKDVVISPEYAHQQLDNILKPMNMLLVRVRNLYLADSLGQTLKFLFIMYILTYIGSWFNLLTLLTMVWVGAFTVPKFYVLYRDQIDSVWGVVLEGFRDVRQQVLRAAHRQVDKLRPKGSRSVSSARSNSGRVRTQEVRTQANMAGDMPQTDGNAVGMDGVADGGGADSTYYYKKETIEKDQ